MKKILLASLISLMTMSTVNAQARCCWRGGYYGGWVAPAVVGGVIGYELARPTTVIVQQPGVVYTAPPVVVQPSPVMVQQPPAGYHWQQITDPQTNTQKMALVPN